MALWDDLLAEVVVYTKRPDLVARTELALRQATRAAHKTGKHWRDIVEETLPVALTEVQQIDLTLLTRFRQVATLGPASQVSVKYCPVIVDDLLDLDGYLRKDVYWAVGSTLNFRPSTLDTNVLLRYYQHPDVTPATYASWIAAEYRDVIVLWAATIVLNSVNESEIVRNLQSLLAVAVADMQEDNVEIEGR